MLKCTQKLAHILLSLFTIWFKYWPAKPKQRKRSKRFEPMCLFWNVLFRHRSYVRSYILSQISDLKFHRGGQRPFYPWPCGAFILFAITRPHRKNAIATSPSLGSKLLSQTVATTYYHRYFTMATRPLTKDNFCLPRKPTLASKEVELEAAQSDSSLTYPCILEKLLESTHWPHSLLHPTVVRRIQHHQRQDRFHNQPMALNIPAGVDDGHNPRRHQFARRIQ